MRTNYATIRIICERERANLIVTTAGDFLSTATYRNTRRLILRTLVPFFVLLHRLYRGNTRLLISRTLVQFYILPHPPPPPRRVCVFVRLSRVILPTAPGFPNCWKTDPVALEPSKQPKEVSTLIQQWASSLSKTVGFK